MSDDWRPETDALDYFGHQKKRADIENRRPAPMGVHPALGFAIRGDARLISDFNTAQESGFYLAEGFVSNQPWGRTLATPNFWIGTVLAHSAFGGYQEFHATDQPHMHYRRTFLRARGYPELITWGVWYSGS